MIADELAVLPCQRWASEIPKILHQDLRKRRAFAAGVEVILDLTAHFLDNVLDRSKLLLVHSSLRSASFCFVFRDPLPLRKSSSGPRVDCSG